MEALAAGGEVGIWEVAGSVPLPPAAWLGIFGIAKWKRLSSSDRRC